MKYRGKLYGHIGGRKYIPLQMTSDDIEALQRENAKLHESLQKLKEWKKQVEIVESEWNPQEIGRMMNLLPGKSIRRAIEPYIRDLQERLGIDQ